jgi:hypothetical protein
MRKLTLILTIALLTFFAPSALLLAQKSKPKPKPPPQAAFFAAGEADEDGWTRYVSAEGKFNVLFPAEPERAAKTIESGFGKQPLITYTSTFNKIVYVVGFLDFKTPINDESSLRKMYDSWQEGVVSVYPNGELEATDTTYENRPARELTYVADLITIKAKAFFSKGKLFQMMTMHFVEGGDALLREVSVKNEKFFDSLRLDTMPVVPTKNVSLVGEIRNTSYRNNFFNFTLTLPENWLVINQEDTNLMREGTRDRSSQQGRAEVSTSLNRTTFLFNLSRTEIGSTDNASIIGAAETVPPVKATLPQLATAISLNFVRSGYTLEGAIKYPKVDGVGFAVINMKKTSIYGAVIRQRLYITRAKGYLLEFVATYSKEDDIARFEEMMKTLKFTKK